jgi:hypothetical protein
VANMKSLPDWRGLAATFAFIRLKRMTSLNCLRRMQDGCGIRATKWHAWTAADDGDAPTKGLPMLTHCCYSQSIEDLAMPEKTASNGGFCIFSQAQH